MSYLEFSEIYDSLMEDIPYKEWAEFLKGAIGKRKSILESACGTGNITMHLAEEDYKITAFDLSQDMLIKAYEKLRKSTNVELLKLDMTKFKLNRLYDAVICCCDGINYLIDNEALRAFFENAYKHLDNNGVFIFDYSNLYKFENLLGNNTIINEENDIFIVWENKYNSKEKTCEMIINFFVKDSKNLYKRIIEHQKQRTFDLDFIERELEKVGFSSIEAYNGYTKSLNNDINERTVIVCRKENL